MRIVWLGVVLVTWFLGEVRAAAGSLTLVRDGRSVSTIVMADRPGPAARKGAKELQAWLLRITGATVPIRSGDGVLPAASESLVLVGDTKETALLGLRSSDFALEELRIKTAPGRLVLIGDDERPDGMRLRAAEAARDAWYQKLGISWSLNVPRLQFYGY